MGTRRGQISWSGSLSPPPIICFCFLPALGKVYWCKCYETFPGGPLEPRQGLVNLLNMEEHEKLATVLAVPEFTPGAFVLMATKKGL